MQPARRDWLAAHPAGPGRPARIPACSTPRASSCWAAVAAEMLATGEAGSRPAPDQRQADQRQADQRQADQRQADQRQADQPGQARREKPDP